MENVRIAVLDANDVVKTFLDNQTPDALHYYDDELHEYLQGAAATFKLTALSDSEDAQYLVEGNKLSFTYNGKDYYFNIVTAEKDEIEVMVEAYSLSFELLNEYVNEYDPGKAISFTEYLNRFDPEHVLTVGKNEVSELGIWHKFDNNETLLARVFALADLFMAEVEFSTELDDNYALKRIVMNIYRKNDGVKYQGMGKDRTDIRLRYGQNVTGITKKSSILNLYTAVFPTGKDGLTITDYEYTVKDEDGNVKFSTEKGSPYLRAPQARDRFPSNLFSEDRYILQYKSYELSDVPSLCHAAVNDLEKNCVPEVEYKVEGYFDTGIGDTVEIEDGEFNPVLYLQARVTEQIRSFTDPTRNKTVFSNFKELQSQLSDETLRRMQEMINANKVYTCSIVTDKGIVFKNNTGETTLTASIMDGGTDMTDTLTINWTKDGKTIGSGKSVKVTAADVVEKSVYRYEAVDAGGKFRGSYEVTVMDVKDGEPGPDGKTQYLHTKFSNDGGKTFTANNGETPGKFMGYYVDFVESDSNNPDDYTWVKVEGDKGEPGKDGADGKDATAYSMQVSAYAIVRTTDGRYTPENIAVSGKSQTGAADLKNYACRFKIEETTDMETWITKYLSNRDESSKTYVPSEGIRALCCSMYLAGGTTTLLDRQIIPVVSDGRNGIDGLDGLQGPKGDQGIPGKDGADGVDGKPGAVGKPGADGKTSYFHIKYSAVSNPTSASQMTETPNIYIGTYVDYTATDSTDPKKYTWSRFQGVQGDKGDQGIPGKNGVNGETHYLHIAYANSTDGKTGFSVSDSTNKLYIGQYTDTVQEDSTDPAKYSWTKIKGDAGAAGKDSYTVILSNESHTFVGGTNAALNGSTVCKVIAYKGATLIPATIGTISGLPAGMTVSIQNNGKTNAQFTVNVTTAMKTLSGELTIPITVDGKVFSKTFSYALALKGSDGKPGAPGDKGDPTGILELPTEPPTKYEGMLWKCTGNLNGFIRDAVYRWNGTKWELFTFSAKNIKVDELSAIVANLGTITAGIIKNADGTFEIDAKYGNIRSYDNVKGFYLNGDTGYPRLNINAGSISFNLDPEPYNPEGEHVWNPDVEINGSGVYKGTVEVFEVLKKLGFEGIMVVTSQAFNVSTTTSSITVNYTCPKNPKMVIPIPQGGGPFVCSVNYWSNTSTVLGVKGFENQNNRKVALVLIY